MYILQMGHKCTFIILCQFKTTVIFTPCGLCSLQGRKVNFSLNMP